MIEYVIDSSALWRMLRTPEDHDAWWRLATDGGIGSCAPQRTEFRRSARNTAEFDDMSAMFDTYFPVVPPAKEVWRWVDSAQFRLVAQGAHRAFSLVDLLVCATAATHGIAVVHDDGDFEVAARLLPDVRSVRVGTPAS